MFYTFADIKIFSYFYKNKKIELLFLFFYKSINI